jgi:hypothetical protein
MIADHAARVGIYVQPRELGSDLVDDLAPYGGVDHWHRAANHGGLGGSSKSRNDEAEEKSRHDKAHERFPTEGELSYLVYLISIPYG